MNAVDQRGDQLNGRLLYKDTVTVPVIHASTWVDCSAHAMHSSSCSACSSRPMPPLRWQCRRCDAFPLLKRKLLKGYFIDYWYLKSMPRYRCMYYCRDAVLITVCWLGYCIDYRLVSRSLTHFRRDSFEVDRVAAIGRSRLLHCFDESATTGFQTIPEPVNRRKHRNETAETGLTVGIAVRDSSPFDRWRRACHRLRPEYYYHSFNYLLF